MFLPACWFLSIELKQVMEECTCNSGCFKLFVSSGLALGHETIVLGHACFRVTYLDFMLVVSDCNIEAKLVLYAKHGDSAWFYFFGTGNQSYFRPVQSLDKFPSGLQYLSRGAEMCHSYKPILFIGLNNLSGYATFISSKQSVLSFMLVFMFKFPRDL
jgi:hypothetical protein